MTGARRAEGDENTSKPQPGIRVMVIYRSILHATLKRNYQLMPVLLNES